MVCFLASRLCGIAATLVCLLLCGTKAALASNWSVTYSPSATTAADNGFAIPNSSVTKTKTLTITATLHWQGTGAPPSRILVVENAGVTWKTTMNSILAPPDDGPPPTPSGTMSGSGSTGLTEAVTKTPDPWTAYAKGEHKQGTRKTTVTVPASGDVVLPSVTLTATSTVTTTSTDKGNASVSLDGYTVSIPEGEAHASASYNMVPDANSDWTTDFVVYDGVKPSGDIYSDQAMNFPKIALDLNNGKTGDYAVSVQAIQFLKTSVEDPGLCRLYGSKSVEGYVSSDSCYAESECEISGSAPNSDGFTYSKEKSYTHTNSNPAALGGATHNNGTPGWTLRNYVTLKAQVRVP